jgi:TolB-like protein/DNA-binding winged helix-turn-helix (wHTH) protein
VGAPVRATQDTDDRPVSPRQHAFGAFELDRKSGELRKHGLKVKLADQPLQVLLLLLEHPGDVVGRDDIRRRLWSSDTFVDFDAGLSSAVRKLRDALGDSAEHPRFIETLPKRGYRFIAPVSATADASAEPVASPAPSSARPRKYYWMPVAWVLAVAAGIVLILALAGGPWRIRPAPPLSIQSIAVLPFAIVGDDPAQQYFADGMTEGITGHLAQAGGFLVISRTSAMHYKHTTKQRPAIGRELQVDAIVEGSVTRSGDQVRISARVMPVSGDRQIWAGEHDGNLRDVVALQDRVAQAIVETIGGRAAPARHSRPSARLHRRHTTLI